MQIQTPDQMLSRIQKELPFSRTPNTQENPFQRENIERESPFHRQAIDTVSYLRRLRHRYSMSAKKWVRKNDLKKSLIFLVSNQVHTSRGSRHDEQG